VPRRNATLHLIHLYRNLTPTKVGDSKETCFWLDSWLGNKPLSIQYPTLFSHVQNPNITVADVYSENSWELRFHHITSQRTDNELVMLLAALGEVTLNDEPDERFMRFGPDKKFSMKSCYYALNFGGITKGILKSGTP
jgi:hypothetical protein